jgi:hypothetical protein
MDEFDLKPGQCKEVEVDGKKMNACMRQMDDKFNINLEEI